MCCVPAALLTKWITDSSIWVRLYMYKVCGANMPSSGRFISDMPIEKCSFHFSLRLHTHNIYAYSIWIAVFFKSHTLNQNTTRKPFLSKPVTTDIKCLLKINVY